MSTLVQRGSNVLTLLTGALKACEQKNRQKTPGCRAGSSRHSSGAELQNRIRGTLEEEGNDFFTRHFIPANEEPALDSDQFATVFAFQTYLNGLNAEIPEHLATDK